MNSPVRLAFATLGCKLNFAETSAIQSNISKGFITVPFRSVADVYIINTCTVTEAADKKGRNMISRAHRTNPDAKIIVMGCQSQTGADAISELPGVTLVIGNDEKFGLGEWINRIHTDNVHKKINIGSAKGSERFFPALSFGGRTRCFVKVQDGCDYFCSYCIVPYARGKSRNAPISDVIAQLKTAEQRGINEIVLSGVNIGDFGKSTGETYTDLLKAIIRETSIPRIRIGSVEPDLLSDEIIELVSAQKRLMPHFHLPMQSACNEVLRSMNRRNTVEFFDAMVKKIKKGIPDAFIGADLIVGFPGENEGHFAETISFLEKAPFSALHVFPFSVRKGTTASEIREQVPYQEKEKRKRQALELSDRKKREFYDLSSRKIYRVLAERTSAEGISEGFSENYIPVFFQVKDKALKNVIVDVKLSSEIQNGKVKGEML